MLEATENREPVQKHVPTYSPSTFDEAEFQAAMDAQSGKEAAPSLSDSDTGANAGGSPTPGQGVMAASPGSEPNPAQAQGTEQAAPAADGSSGALSEEQKKRDRTIHGRIAEIVAERNREREEKIRLAEELQRFRAQAQPPVPPQALPMGPLPGQPVLPRLADPKYGKAGEEIDTEAYERDLAQYHERLTDWKLNQALAARDRREAEARAQQEAQRIAAASAEREHAYAEAHPDFGEAVQTFNSLIVDHRGAPVSRQAADLLTLIRQSDDGPAIAHYLGRNPHEALGLLQARDPVSLGIGFANAQFRATQPSAPARPVATPAQESVLTALAQGVPRSKAPLPIATVDGRSGSVAKPLAELAKNMDEFMEATGTQRRFI